MLVDDEPAAIARERRIIENRTTGFAVAGKAHSVDSALALYREMKPEVVLTDMKMPKKSGVELIREIMSGEESHTICVAISGFSDFDYVHDAFSSGAFDYLLKPIDPEKLEKLFARMKEQLDRVASEGKEQSCPGKISSPDMIDRIEQYIREHLDGNNSIPEICNAFGISQPYLSRIFKNERNCTYNEFLTGIRIEEAKRMLLSDRYSIGQVAKYTGYNSQFYFSRVFKNVTGYAPSEFCRNAAGDGPA